MFFKTKDSGSVFDNASPRLTFLMGLILGLAVLSLVGFFVFLGVFLKGGSLQYAAADNQQAPPAPVEVAKATEPVKIDIAASDHTRGNKNAKVTIVEFSDFQCPFCGRFNSTMLEMIKEYGDKVRWVYKHFPLDSMHPNARPAAEASECAAEQGKFWEFADELYANQERLGEEFYSSLAKGLGLDVSKFSSCVSSRKYQQRVEDDYQQGLAAGVNGTPGNFVNGQPLVGAVPLQQLTSVIDSQL